MRCLVLMWRLLHLPERQYSDASDSIDEYVARYNELHDALLKAKGSEEKTYSIKKQLLDLQTELNDKFVLAALAI